MIKIRHLGEYFGVRLLDCNAVGVAGRYRRFGGAYCLYLKGMRDKLPPSQGHSFWRWKLCFTPKRWYLSVSPHGVTTQETDVDSKKFVRWVWRTMKFVQKLRGTVWNFQAQLRKLLFMTSVRCLSVLPLQRCFAQFASFFSHFTASHGP
jgi:hypothetical protein